MEIEPGKGLGPIKFGMSPKEVMSIMGDKQVYEPWMGGNLNDALLYPGIIIGFDACNSKGPLENSRVYEFIIDASFSDVQFRGMHIFHKSKQEIEEMLLEQRIPYQVSTSGYDISIDSLGLEVGWNDEGEVDFISFWSSVVSASEETKVPDKSQSLDNLLNYLKTSTSGWSQYFQRLEAIEKLGNIGSPKAIPVLEEIVRKDTQEFDAWGLGVGFSMAYFAQAAIEKIRAMNHLNPNFDVVAFFVRFFQNVSYHIGAVKAEFSRYENPTWEADWIRAKQIISGRLLLEGEPLQLVETIGGQNLAQRSDEEAYHWLEKMIVDVERR